MNKKRLRHFITLLSIFLFSFSIAGAQPILKKSVVKKNGQLSVKGAFLYNQNGERVILNGVSFGWHNWWPRFYNANTTTWLQKDWKCTVVRAAIGVEPDGAFLQNPDKAYECLYNVVDAAIANGMYVIIDWHTHSIKTEEAKQFFTTVATKYKDYPNIIYEIFNEPIEDSWEDVKAYSEEIIKTIREIDPHNIILVGTPHWDQDVHLAADNPIRGYSNIMYTLHFYAASHKQVLRDRADYAIRKGLPIFVSECAGMEATGNGPIDKEEWEKWVKWMDRNKLSWAVWTVSDKDETAAFVKSKNSPVSGWKKDDLKEWGQIVRETLRKR
jgi:endoglucanase